jgi:hypothetical protein
MKEYKQNTYDPFKYSLKYEAQDQIIFKKCLKNLNIKGCATKHRKFITIIIFNIVRIVTAGVQKAGKILKYFPHFAKCDVSICFGCISDSWNIVPETR